MQILFVGTTSAFSLPPLQALLASEHLVTGVVAPDRSVANRLPPARTETLPLLPLNTNHTIITLARTHGIPVIGLSAAQPTDVIVVACFPHRLPNSFLRLARRAALNIHPSWLPEHRGPAPLFWQLRAGITAPAVTLHHISSELDAGDIVAQARVPLPTGATGPEADHLLATAGAHLLLQALDGQDFTAAPQAGPGSYQSWPQESDWQVPTEWTVQRAFNFLRGTEEWGHSYTLLTTRGALKVSTAVSYTLDDDPEPGAVRSEDDGWLVGLADGWLLVK